MDDITVLQECVVKVEEIKEEVDATFGNGECDMPGENSEVEVKAPVAVLLQPKVEVEEAEEQEDHLAVDPLAGCEEWNEKKPFAETLLLRVKKEEAVETEPEIEAGAEISSERATFQEPKDVAEESCGSNRAEDCEASKSENVDVPTHNKQPLACVHCSGTIRYDKTFEQHEREHPEEPKLLTCDTCQHQFTARIAPLRHTRAQMHVATRKTGFICSTCGKEFKCRGNLKEHMRIHTGEKPYLCELCGKGFTQAYALKRHRRKHTGERPYSCSTCNKRFSCKHTLDIHKNLHSNIMPYECRECGKTYLYKSSYSVHLRVHTGERPYKCSVCPKAFKVKASLDSHMFTHSREAKNITKCEVCGVFYTIKYMKAHKCAHTQKPYKCRFCEVAFAQISIRRRHEESHSDSKIQCKVCGKKFLTTHKLKVHMRCHTGEKPYKCGYCDKAFRHSYTLKNHVVIHTKNILTTVPSAGRGTELRTSL